MVSNERRDRGGGEGNGGNNYSSKGAWGTERKGNNTGKQRRIRGGSRVEGAGREENAEEIPSRKMEKTQ